MPITVGQSYTVTDAQEAPHFLEPGQRVRVIRDNFIPATRSRPALEAHRWMVRGKSRTDGKTITQWLAEADLT